MKSITPAHTADVIRLIATARVGRFQLRTAALCGVVTLLDGLDAQITGYLAPALAREWHLEGAALGRIFSAGLAGMMIGLLVIGPLADRFGRRRTIALSTVLLGVCTMLAATANGPGELMAYRVAAGIGLGGTLPNAVALTADYCPDRWRGTLLAAMFAGFSVGSILGGGLTAAIVPEYGWRTGFFVAGALTLPLAPVLWRLLPDSPRILFGAAGVAPIALLRRINPDVSLASDTRLVLPASVAGDLPPRQLFQAGRAGGTLLIWLACFMGLLELYFLNNWLPTLLTNGGLGLRPAVLATTAFSVGGIAGCMGIGRFMDRFGFAPVLAAAFVGGAASVPLIGLAPTALAATIGSIFLGGFFVAGAQIGLNALAVSFYPASIRSTGVSWALGAGRFGAILGPLLAGWMVGAGWPAHQVFLVAAMPMLGGAAAMLAMVVRDEQCARTATQPSPSVGRMQPD